MELHDDDKPIGRILTRREVLALLGSAGAAILVAGTGFRNLKLQTTATPSPTGTAIPTCVVRPEMTEGPYFVDDQLNRIDLRIDPTDGSVKEGIPLYLVFHVSSVSADVCEPLADVQVDVWSCDVDGIYSGVTDAGFDTTGEKWLRGYQITDEQGIAKFLTIFPGWYSGRTVHIHFKIRTDPESDSGYEFTSQFFIPDDLTDEIFTLEPYNQNGERDTRNDNDMHYANGGEQLLLELVAVSEEDMSAIEATAEPTPQITGQSGYQADFYIGLDLSDTATGASDSFQTGGAAGGGVPGGTPPSGDRPPSVTPAP